MIWDQFMIQNNKNSEGIRFQLSRFEQASGGCIVLSTQHVRLPGFRLCRPDSPELAAWWT